MAKVKRVRKKKSWGRIIFFFLLMGFITELIRKRDEAFKIHLED